MYPLHPSTEAIYLHIDVYDVANVNDLESYEFSAHKSTVETAQ
jgi:hypothetical protein